MVNTTFLDNTNGRTERTDRFASGEANDAAWCAERRAERANTITAELVARAAQAEAADAVAKAARTPRDGITSRIASSGVARAQPATFAGAGASAQARLDEATSDDLGDTGALGDGSGASATPNGSLAKMHASTDATPNVTSIVTSLAALLSAAAADGIRLAGVGYRNRAAQITARIVACAVDRETSDSDLDERCASTGTPLTARPSHSELEWGFAVDLALDGVLIGTRTNPGFVWLAANAARFGLFNLASEPWHWSTSGS